MSKSSIVWVANRNEPLTDSFGVLTISENGNLVALNGKKQVVWSTNVSHVASNSSARLLDYGNLVLVDGTTGERMWQSFQHPCDTLLQDMILSTNQHTGEKVKLISWNSTSDPSSGEFSCGLEPHNVTQVFVWKQNRPYWRSGPWNGSDFIGIPRRSSMTGNGFQKNSWEVVKIIGDSECDVYVKCGPFGICNEQSSPICFCLTGFEQKNKEEWERHNWTSRCVRREALQCERDNNGSQGSQIDGFLKLENVKVPDQAERLPYNFIDTIDCQSPCLKNCSCKAYAYEPGLGCMVLSVDLVDLVSNLPGGGGSLLAPCLLRTRYLL
ncbi:hypothetical protein K1719_034360 [Acacia pycnantha]|nr:hypothetical protein K1719_034360 [Acacia pycnantha]